MDQHFQHQTDSALTHDALQKLYPMVHRIVGDNYFDLLSQRYSNLYENEAALQADPEHFGHRFGQLLLKHYMEHPDLDKLAVLPELARLEWLLHDSEGANDCYQLNTAQLDTVSPEAQPRICFHACPSVRLMYSRWPLLSVWQAYQQDDMDHLSPEGGEQWLCIYQQHKNGKDTVVVEALSEPMAQLMGAILKGYSMAQLANIGVDLSHYLPILVKKQWLDYFTLKDE